MMVFRYHRLKFLLFIALFTTYYLWIYVNGLIVGGGRKIHFYEGNEKKSEHNKKKQAADGEVKEPATKQESEYETGTEKEQVIDPSPLPPPTLHLIGERHSGTNWMTNHLHACFGHRVRFLPSYSDWKHWFQFEETSKYPNAVVVAQFRNVFDWTEAMRYYPHHAPVHFNLNWNEFVTKPWTIARYGEDIQYENATIQSHPLFKGNECKYGRARAPYQIIPCRAPNRVIVNCTDNPESMIETFYELRNDGSGLPYNSILELRSAKIHNFLSVAQFGGVKRFHVVRYDDYRRTGVTTEALLRQLEHDLGIPANCTPTAVDPKHETKHILPMAFIDYLKAHVNWETEARIGYTLNNILR